MTLAVLRGIALCAALAGCSAVLPQRQSPLSEVQAVSVQAVTVQAASGRAPLIRLVAAPAAPPQPAGLAPGLRSWPAGSDCAPLPHSAQLIHEVWLRVNTQRRSAGLPMLGNDPRLANTAHRHACDLARRGIKGHVGSDGSHLRERLAREGYAARSGAENAGHGFENTPAGLVAGWMGSPGHRANLLDPNLVEAGVGVAQDPLGPDGRMKWVMVYALPR